MEIHRYYVSEKETVYNVVVVVVILFLYFLTYPVSSWIIQKDFYFSRILTLFPVVRIFAIILAAFVLRSCFDSRVNPTVSVCSHFLIIGYSNTLTIPWDEIHSVLVTEDNIKIQFRIDSKKGTRKESIKHVINKRDLIQKIKDYCSEYHIDFSQE